MINHRYDVKIVMLVEIPDPEVIFAVVVAFLVGLVGLYAYYKIQPHVSLKRAKAAPGQLERLEYYESQLIEMKIRLDALGLDDNATKTPKNEPKNGVGTRQVTKVVEEAPQTGGVVEKQPSQAQRLPNMAPNNAADYVLHLITDKSMTSRDIQVTLGRSREHTSRLMKKLFEGGYVDRNVNAKPYTYSITDKGREKIGLVEGPITTT